RRASRTGSRGSPPATRAVPVCSVICPDPPATSRLLPPAERPNGGARARPPSTPTRPSRRHPRTVERVFFDGVSGGLCMRGTLFLTLLLAAGAAWADDPPRGPRLIATPEAFKSLDHLAPPSVCDQLLPLTAWKNANRPSSFGRGGQLHDPRAASGNF